MQENRTLLYFKSRPKNTAYFVGDIVPVPNDMAKEFIYDEHAIDAGKVLDPKPYFEPEEVESLSSTKEVEAYVEEKEAEIPKYRNDIKSAGNELERISAKITEIKSKRDKNKKGSYRYVQLDMQIEKLEKEFPKLEETIKNTAIKKREAEILYLNVQIKLYKGRFQLLKESDEFQEIDEHVKKLVKKNNQLKNRFEKATEGLKLKFLPARPYLTGRGLAAIQNNLGKSDQILTDISNNLTNGFKSKLYEIYKEDFEGVLRDDE